MSHVDPSRSSSTSPPHKVKRAFHGLAGSPLAQYERGVQSFRSKSFRSKSLRSPIPYDKSSLFEGRTIGLPPLDRKALRKLAAAARAANWRKNHDTPEIKTARAKKVKALRAVVKDETERITEIEKIVKANPVPLFVMKSAPHGLGLLETGGYDYEALEEIVQMQDSPKSNKGYGPGSEGEEPQFESEFAERAFLRFRNPKQVKMLHQFVYESTYKKKGAALACLKCREEISPSLSPEQDIELTFRHIFEQHPDVYATWLARLSAKTGCQEDHTGMTERYKGGETIY